MRKISTLLMAMLFALCFGVIAQNPLYYTDFSTVPVPADEADAWGTTDINIFTSGTPDPNTIIVRNGITFNSGAVGERMFVYPNGSPLANSENIDPAPTKGRCYWVAVTKRTYGETDHAFITLPAVTNPAQIVINGAAGENPTNGYQSYRVFVLDAATDAVLETFDSQQLTVKGDPKQEIFNLANKNLGSVKVKITITSTTTADKNASVNLYDIWIYGEGGAPQPTTPSIALASGSTTPTVLANSAIGDIKYKWGGTATGINISWDGSAPAGITAANSGTEANTFVISGTPTTAGTYGYSVVATDGTNNTTPLTGTITVNPVIAGKKVLAYVTALTSGAATDGTDIALTTALANDYTVRLVNTKDALTAESFANDDVVLLSCFPGSGDQGIKALIGINKPFVSLKPFQFQWKADKSNWGFGAPDNVSNKITDAAPNAGTIANSVKVTVPAHAIFKGITLTNSELIFATDSKHGDKRVITFMKGWHGTNEANTTTLAVLPSIVSAPPALADAQKDGTQGTYVEAAALATIFEITPGTSLTNTYDGAATTWSAKNVFIGVSEQVSLSDNSGSYITEDFKTLIKNSVAYVLGGTTDIKPINAASKVAVSKDYFDITGKKVYEGAKGFVIVKTTYEDGSFSTEKLFNK